LEEQRVEGERLTTHQHLLQEWAEAAELLEEIILSRVIAAAVGRHSGPSRHRSSDQRVPHLDLIDAATFV